MYEIVVMVCLLTMNPQTGSVKPECSSGVVEVEGLTLDGCRERITEKGPPAIEATRKRYGMRVVSIGFVCHPVGEPL